MIFSFVNLKKITDSYVVKEQKRIEQLFRHPLFIGLIIKIFLIVAITSYSSYMVLTFNSTTRCKFIDPWTNY